MSGLKLGNDDIAAFENIVYRDAEVQISDLPDVINSFLVSVTDGVPALCLDSLLNLRNELTACPNEFVVSEFEVYSVLMKLNVRKAARCDSVNNQLLKALADVLAAPIVH